MNIEDIKLLLEYNDWANKRILAMAEQVSPEELMMPSAIGFCGTVWFTAPIMARSIGANARRC